MSAKTVSSVEMSAIHKNYGGIKALRGVDLQIEKGSIHALVGENGAGKSTLLKILQGVVAPSSGTVKVFGEEVSVFTPEAAGAMGVGMIFQELSLIPSMTVAENIFLNREPLKMGLVTDDQSAARQSHELLAELGVEVDTKTRVSDLSIGQAQMVEIAKAISQNAKVLIMDEPTSALNVEEVHRLFAFLRKITANGVSVIYVSHRMDEIMEIATHVSILRDGQNVVSGLLSDFTLDSIIENMIGKRVSNFTYRARPVDRSGQPLLEVRDLSGSSGKPIDVSFDLFGGEVLGVAGLMGAGRTELARTLFGIDRVVSGGIKLRGKPVSIGSTKDAIDAGIVLVPESRQFEGLHIEDRIDRNASLPQLSRLMRGLSVDRRAEQKLASEIIEMLRVKAEAPSTIVKSLSGGNQQKVAIGKWLSLDPDVVIFDEPTAGVDIGSKSEIIELMRDLAARGKGVIIISSEPAELLAASDRIIVFSRGRLKRKIDRDEIESWSTHEDDGAAHSETALLEHGLQMAIQGVN